MKPKTLVLLCVAVGCGLVVMIAMQQAMNKPGDVKTEMVSVLVAATDIDPGMILKEENVEFKEFPKDSVSADCVLTPDEYRDRSLNVAVSPGDFILKAKLSEPGVSGKSILIPPGMRIATINVDETQTASGMLKAGDKVDVLVTYDAKVDNLTQTRTQTLLECVVVFAVADQTKGDLAKKSGTEALKARQISLIVLPEEAGFLSLAQRKGQLALTLRNPTDDSLTNNKAATESLMAELRGVRTGGESGDGLLEGGYEPGEAPEPEPEPQNALQNFLSAAPQPAPQPTVIMPQPEPAPVVYDRPTWEVKVYVGNDTETYAFEIDEATGEALDKDPTVTSPGSAPAAASASLGLPLDHAPSMTPEALQRLAGLGTGAMAGAAPGEGAETVPVDAPTFELLESLKESFPWLISDQPDASKITGPLEQAL